MKPQLGPQIILKIILAAGFVLLVGCSTTPAPATQRVDVPVPVSCVKAADLPKRPDYAVEKLAATASDGEKVLAFAADWPLGRKYEGKLEAIISGCR
jgi:hypothetical protein